MSKETLKTHYMSLQDDPFNKIRQGTKNIEMRLHDEKRRLIDTNDTIVFTNISTNDKLYTRVTEIFCYKSFAELYDHHDKISIGYESDEIANPDDMLMYYTKEAIEENGVVAIKISLI